MLAPWRDPSTFLDPMSPLVVALADRGKADPYHNELSETDLVELAELAKAVSESYGGR